MDSGSGDDKSKFYLSKFEVRTNCHADIMVNVSSTVMYI